MAKAKVPPLDLNALPEQQEEGKSSRSQLLAQSTKPTSPWRQFRALVKKNFILWRRQLDWSMFEILCSLSLAFLLVFVRIYVPGSWRDEFDYSYSRPNALVGFSGSQEKKDWDFSYKSILKAQRDLDPFLIYHRRHVQHDFHRLAEGHKLFNDNQGPFLQVQYQCFERFSNADPPQPAPIVAHVGKKNELSTLFMDYFGVYYESQKTFFRQAVFDRFREERMEDDVLTKFPEFRFEHFETAQDLRDYVAADDYLVEGGKPGICWGFEFEQPSEEHYELSLFYLDQTEFAQGPMTSIPSLNDEPYNIHDTSANVYDFEVIAERGFSQALSVAANVVLKTVTGNYESRLDMIMVPMAHKPFQNDFSIEQLMQKLLGFAVLFMYSLPYYNMVFTVTKEKETRTRESMRMMGVRTAPYWLSWYIYFVFINTVISVLSSLTLHWYFFKSSDVRLVFALLWLYGQSLFGQVIVAQSCFSKAKEAGVASAISIVGLYMSNLMFREFGFDPFTIETTRLVLSIVPQIALYQSCCTLSFFEFKSYGITFDSWDKVVRGYSFQEGLGMLALGFVLTLLFGIYLDSVLPTEYGKRKGLLFCCPRCRPCRGKDRAADRGEAAKGTPVISARFDEGALLRKENYEEPPAEAALLEQENACLKVHNLVKQYGNGFCAVKGVNLKMYSGQIFALLGQNGAGKSSTISMLTGLIPKSQGQAQIFDKDLFEEMEAVRRVMGVCPQHDVLFDQLTPEEHLDFFYEIKGGDPVLKAQQIDTLIKDVGVDIDRKKEASALSGGNKRKLSVAIAMCANSRFVVLDEPTAGMDLNARRHLWDMLKKYRQNRIILLTTHYMDEADVLGDRIGIMVQGQILCLGSSHFLKNNFADGYKLTMVKQSKEPNKLVQPYLEKVFGRLDKLSEVANEMQFKINSSKSHLFSSFFKRFDSELTQLGLLSYGISMTTLEEVFLRVVDKEALQQFLPDAEERKAKVGGGESSGRPRKEVKSPRLKEGKSGKDPRSPRSPLEPKQSKAAKSAKAASAKEQSPGNLVGTATAATSLEALFRKRAQIYKRDKIGLLCEVVMPVGLVFCALLSKKFAYSDDYTRPYLQIRPEHFPHPHELLMNVEPTEMPEGHENVMPAEIAANFPGGAEMFNVQYFDDYELLLDFSDELYLSKDSRPTKIPRFGSYQVFKADKTKHHYQVNTFVNQTTRHGMMYYSQFMYEAILRTASDRPNLKFDVKVVPFPLLNIFKKKIGADFTVYNVLIINIALALVPSSIIGFIVREREKQQKHMQLISGVSLPSYWLSSLLTDLCKSYILIGFIVLFLHAFGEDYEGMVPILMAYPLSIVPYTYAMSTMFTADTSAQAITLFYHFLFGVVMSFQTVMMRLQMGAPGLTGDLLRWACTVCPTFCAAHSMLLNFLLDKISALRDYYQIMGEIESRKFGFVYVELPTVSSDPWHQENMKGDLAIMMSQGVLGLLILAIVEMDIFRSFRVWINRVDMAQTLTEAQMESDVRREEKRVEKMTPIAQVVPKNSVTSDLVRVAKIRKVYGGLCKRRMVAVDRISFGVNFGECFALLGVNGAGKSTTFKSLTKDIEPTSGTVHVAGYDAQSQFAEARKLIGYCPQSDAIFDLMSVEEHLWFYARIKGLPKDSWQEQVEQTIDYLNLETHRHKLAGQLSGGNKRKLSVGIAIIGNPPIILLDEPSAGMDPEARRFMWTVVEKISQRDKNCAVVLTTHSMEEAEALSTKLGIMVRGGIFKCFGSGQHIKNKYGTGYEVGFMIRKPTGKELVSFAKKIGFYCDLDSQIDLTSAISLCYKVSPIVIGQISPQGLGSSLVQEAEMSGKGSVKVKNFVHFVFTMTHGLKVIQYMASLFKRVKLLEQVGSLFKIKIAREEQTIGFLFGKLESKKEQLKIDNYSVCQTSLEQIFQNFANQSVQEQSSLTFALDIYDNLFISQQGNQQLSAASESNLSEMSDVDSLRSSRKARPSAKDKVALLSDQEGVISRRKFKRGQQEPQSMQEDKRDRKKLH